MRARTSWEVLEILRWGKDRNRERKQYSSFSFLHKGNGEGDTSSVSIPYPPHPTVPAPVPVPRNPGKNGNDYSVERSVYVSVSYRRFNLPPGNKSKDKIKANTVDTVDYLLRFEDKKAFSAGSTDIGKDDVHEMFDDDAVFKIIVSPEDGTVMTESYVREITAAIEAKAGIPLKWVSVIHDNTDHPHAHIIISRTDGEGLSWEKPLSFPPDFISRGIREIAQKIATRTLGRKSPDEVKYDLLRSVYAEGLGHIDHKIFGYPPKNTGLFTMTEGGYAVLNQQRLERLPKWQQNAVLTRLEILSSIPELEIAKDRDSYVCYIPNDVKNKLADHQKLSQFKDISEEISIIPSNKPLKEPIRGTVVRTVVVDDNAPKAGFVIRSEEGRLYYVEGEVPYKDLDTVGKQVEVTARDARSERYRTPVIKVKRGGKR